MLRRLYDRHDEVSRGFDSEEEDGVDGSSNADPFANDVDLHPLESKFGGMTHLSDYTHVKIRASFDKCWVCLRSRWQDEVEPEIYSHHEYDSSATVRGRVRTM